MIASHVSLLTALHCIVLKCIALCPNCCMASFFIRVDAANEAVYELVAEPVQEPPAGEQQIEEAIKQAPEDIVNPADLQGKPRVHRVFARAGLIIRVLAGLIQASG